jgi:hypothetical protein
MIRRILICTLFMILAGCINSSDAVNALQDASFTDIKITGYNWFTCSKDDFYHTGFIAKNPQGRIVKGTVCSGFLFKNSTIRFS